MHIIPLDDRILVRPVASDTRPAQECETAEGHVDTPQRGVVIAVGSGTRTADGTVIPLAITAGDQISFGRQTAQSIIFAGIQCWIMKAEDVLTIDIAAAPFWSRRS